MGWTWPRFRMPLLETGAETVAAVPRPHAGARPTIFGQVFEPFEDAAQITRCPDKWEIRLENPAL
ncbi:hypothetical protein IWQ56_002762, partial [Coemansia nantahalensis]